MPIVSPLPWRHAYFENIECPPDVCIPTSDTVAYKMIPRHNFIYNKLFIADSQGLDCAPHGVQPEKFPVFSKPVYNLRGNSAKSEILTSLEHYRANTYCGHMWSELLVGDQLSTDVAVADGEPVWHVQTFCYLGKQGTFDYFEVAPKKQNPEDAEYLYKWVRQFLKGYTGMVNFETVGGKIVEGHIRFSDMWADIYGRDWLESMVELYKTGKWNYRGRIETGYAVLLYVDHGYSYKIPPSSLVNQLSQKESVSSIQFPFYDDWPPEYFAMPFGGFRYAQINGWDLEACRQYREEILEYALKTRQEVRPLQTII